MIIKKIFKCKLVPKRTKLKLCWAIIRPEITYYSEKWVIKEYMKRKLLCVRKMLRRIFEPTKERDGTWIIKKHDELNNPIRNNNIINCSKTQRLS
jgi:hypothetical protein